MSIEVDARRRGVLLVDLLAGTDIGAGVTCGACEAELLVDLELSQPEARRFVETLGWRLECVPVAKETTIGEVIRGGRVEWWCPFCPAST